MIFGFTGPIDNTKYTVELRDLIDSGVKLWDFDYPSFYSGSEKAEFERKVIDHFYFRQIGQETAGRFLHMFRTKIREIMPYYKQLYETVKIMDELPSPFDNVDVTETFTERRVSKVESTSEADNTRRFSNTPQGSISNIDRYLTEATVDSGTSGGESNEDTETTHTYTKIGNQGVNTYAHDMLEYRETLLNIDMMIIKDLEPLFLGVY